MLLVFIGYWTKTHLQSIIFVSVESGTAVNSINSPLLAHPICITLPHPHYSKDQNRFHISLYSFQAVCDRCFIGRSGVVVNVLSMIQCSTSDGRQRQRERCLCLDVQWGELSIYNSLSCLTGGVLMWWMLFQSGEDSVFLNLGSLRPLWAWTALPNVLLWSFDPYTVLLKNCNTPHTQRHTKTCRCTHTLLHKDNWQLAPPFNLVAQQAMYSNSLLTPAQSTCHE